MPHPYDEIFQHLQAAFSAIEAAGLRDSVAKGGVGEILLARYLGHTLCDSDKGADGEDNAGNLFEYKVSITNQFNFHFGTREVRDPPEAKVRRHFQGISAAICAKREGANIVSAIYVPTQSLIEDLVTYFSASRGNQLNRNYRIQSLEALDGARIIA